MGRTKKDIQHEELLKTGTIKRVKGAKVHIEDMGRPVMKVSKEEVEALDTSW